MAQALHPTLSQDGGGWAAFENTGWGAGGEGSEERGARSEVMGVGGARENKIKSKQQLLQATGRGAFVLSAVLMLMLAGGGCRARHGSRQCIAHIYEASLSHSYS